MQTRNTTTSSVLIAVLIVITFPIWIGIIGGLFGVVAGLFGAMFGIIAGVFGAVIGGIGGVFGWMVDPFWHDGFHGPFIGGKIFMLIAVVIVVLLITRRK